MSDHLSRLGSGAVPFEDIGALVAAIRLSPANRALFGLSMRAGAPSGQRRQRP